MEPPQFLRDLFRHSQEGMGRLRVRSALNPILWLCGLTSAPAFMMAFLFREMTYLAVTLTVVGAAPVGTAIVGFLFFMLRQPEKLQSEDYQLKHQAIEIARQQGGIIDLTAVLVEPTRNESAIEGPKKGAGS